MPDAANMDATASEDAADGVAAKSGLRRLRAKAQVPRAEEESPIATEDTLSGHAPHATQGTLSATLNPTLNTMLTAHDAADGGGGDDAPTAVARALHGARGLEAGQASHGGVGADAVGDAARASVTTGAPSRCDLPVALQPGGHLASGSITASLSAPLDDVEAGHAVAADMQPADVLVVEAHADAVDEARHTPDVTALILEKAARRSTQRYAWARPQPAFGRGDGLGVPPPPTP